MKKNTKKTLQIISWVLTISLILCSVSLIVLYKTGTLFSGMVKLSVEGEVTENVEELYSAMLYNDSFTFSERVRLLKFNQYFVDNKYIECERVCRKLASFTVTENDPSLLDEEIAATYTEEGNYITFATDEDREYSLPHELHHCMENENLSYADYGWFSEGFTSLVTYEYFGETGDGANVLSFFIRGLCEIVGSDVLFEVSARGDINILKKALMERGIAEETVEDAFAVFYKIWMNNSYGSIATPKQKIESVKILERMYDIANGYPENITLSFVESAESMIMENGNLDHYYLNSAKINNNMSVMSPTASGNTSSNLSGYDEVLTIPVRDLLQQLYDEVESGFYD